jgi:hypothetical protein
MGARAPWRITTESDQVSARAQVPKRGLRRIELSHWRAGSTPKGLRKNARARISQRAQHCHEGST